MSYPLALQPLVIEDDVRTKDVYQDIFATVAREFECLPFLPAPPCLAFSHEEAIRFVDSSKVFHLVVLDLRLPQQPKLPAMEGAELGLDLLARFLERDRFPVPALLVISALIGSTEQARMQERLRNGFYYGRLLAKGDYGLLENEIRQAYREAIRYCSVGIHLRDAKDDRYPTLTPREEDLLRRSALQQHGVVGLDLNWWSAKSGMARSDAETRSWTKVLTGRYVLEGGRGASTPKFFKLLSGSEAQAVVESARQVEHKLPHIKLTSSVGAKSTALVVTEKVGALDERPTSLADFFKQADREQATNIARQITEQVRRLGDLLPESRMLKTILWPAHDVDVLREQWNRLGGLELQQQLQIETDPVSLYSQLVRSEDRVHLNEQSLVHGDLHISNVALDIGANGAQAYIFDPGVITRDVAGRDLAALEVSVILHQRLDSDTFAQVCSALYGSPIPAGGESTASVADPVGKNIIEFIGVLRAAAEVFNEFDVYALMVFDSALTQLGGLAFGSSGNLIWDQRSAVYFLAVVAQWYQKLQRRN